MSSRRHLVARSRVNNQDASPAPRRPRDAPQREPAVLPAYEPPSCALTPEAQRQLDDLRVNHDYSKYKKHVQTAVGIIRESAVAVNDQLSSRKEQVRKADERRAERGNEDKTEGEIENEAYTRHMDKKVGVLTAEAEKALRDLIDYGDELAMQDSIMKDINAAIAAAPAPQPRPARRRRRNSEDEGGEDNDENASQDDNDAPAEDFEIPSAVELLKKAKQDYATEYASKSMRDRYDVNDYKVFKQVIHDAQNPGDDAPPVPHARTWFPDDNVNQGSASRRRRNNTTDNTNNADDSDDDVVIERATTSLKCSLTLQYFKEPFTSKVCNHTFEKFNILEYHRKEGRVFAGPGPLSGKKVVKCPTSGCESMLQPNDFYNDVLVLRKVQRAKAREEREEEEDDDDEDDARPRGNQRNRPASINSEDDSVDIDEDEDQKQKIARIKREKQRSRGPSMAPARGTAGSSAADDDDVDAMDED